MSSILQLQSPGDVAVALLGLVWSGAALCACAIFYQATFKKLKADWKLRGAKSIFVIDWLPVLIVSCFMVIGGYGFFRLLWVFLRKLLGVRTG